MAAMAVPLIVSTALTAGSQIMQGEERAASQRFEQQQQQYRQQELLGQQKQLEAQAENTRIAADQAETARRETLVANMEHIQSLRAGRGVGEASPTGMAILDSITGNAERDIGRERFNYLSKADTTRMAGLTAGRDAEMAGLAASMAGRKAQGSLLAGYLSAGSTVAGAAFKYGSMDWSALKYRPDNSPSSSSPAIKGALY